MIFKEKVYKVVSKIPQGKVLTYSEAARQAGSAGAARAVGTIMRQNPHKSVPCHRVVRSDGTVGKYRGINSGEKIKLLRSEGVLVKNGRIDLMRYLMR